MNAWTHLTILTALILCGCSTKQPTTTSHKQTTPAQTKHAIPFPHNSSPCTKDTAEVAQAWATGWRSWRGDTRTDVPKGIHPPSLNISKPRRYLRDLPVFSISISPTQTTINGTSAPENGYVSLLETKVQEHERDMKLIRKSIDRPIETVFFVDKDTPFQQLQSLIERTTTDKYQLDRVVIMESGTLPEGLEPVPEKLAKKARATLAATRTYENRMRMIVEKTPRMIEVQKLIQNCPALVQLDEEHKNMGFEAWNRAYAKLATEAWLDCECKPDLEYLITLQITGGDIPNKRYHSLLLTPEPTGTTITPNKGATWGEVASTLKPSTCVDLMPTGSTTHAYLCHP